MTITGSGTTAVETVERLSKALNRCFETFEVDEEAFAPDAFFDMLPPFWRFQLRGPRAFADQLRSIAEGPVSVRILRTIPTASGFVTEHEETQHVGDGITARRIWLCEVRDGRITEAAGYCNGGWDAELRARQRAEAPMLREDHRRAPNSEEK